VGDGDASASEASLVARVGEAEVRCRYAGAMLLHPFLRLVGAGDVFARLGSGPARRYDTTSVALCALFGLALGTGSVEATKHLGRADLGVLAGIGAAPELATLRTRLSATAMAATRSLCWARSPGA